MKTCYRLLALVLGALLASSAARAGQNDAAAATPTPALKTEAPKGIAYKIVPTDKLTIGFIGEQDLNVLGKRVDVNGNINLALVQDVHVAGLTVSEAQTAIENSYRDGRILRNPQVVITIEEYAPREVSISGMVKGGGKYPLPPETVMTLKDLILKAGGFTDTANGRAVRISRLQPDGSFKILTKDVQSVILGKATKNSDDASFVLEPGDIVYVPENII